MENQISFSDFLKEGALLEEHTNRHDEDEHVIKPVRIAPFEPANKEDSRKFWKELRHFYRTGEIKTAQQKDLLPVLPAPYLKGADWITDFPFVVNENGKPHTLHGLLKEVIEANFDKKKDRIICESIPRLVKLFRKNMDTRHESYPFTQIAEKALLEFSQIDVHGAAKDRFAEDVTRLKELLPSSAHLLSFSAHCPIHIISLCLDRSVANRKVYIAQCEKMAIDLDEKMVVEKDKTKEDLITAGDEFNEELISFKKIQELQPDKGAELMPQARRKRIHNIIDILNSCHNILLENRGRIIVSKDIYTRLSSISALKNTLVKQSDDENIYSEILNEFNLSIAQLSPLVKAMRIAELEMKNQYIDDVHDDFFEHFNWHRFNAEELALLTPNILIGNTNALMKSKLGEFSKLLSTNKPIRIIAINEKVTSGSNPDINWEDASHTFKQELAAFAISHRSTHTFQGSLDQPLHLLNGIYSAFEANAPSLVNVLVPNDNITRQHFIQITAAVESRYTPVLQYSLNSGKWGSRFDISQNPQPEKDWPAYPFNFKDENEQDQTMDLPFTYADYKALSSEKISELMEVPEEMVNNSLIPIHEFLNLNQEKLTGKVPFIWTIDSDNLLHRLALPYMWVISCQERLDFWNYVQELGGVNSFHVDQALHQAHQLWNEQKEIELADLKSQHEKSMERLKDEAAKLAMEKLTRVLLNMDSASIGNPKAKTTAAPTPTKAKKEEIKAAPEKPIEPKEVKKEAWLETFKCTSCNDCTDNFPDIFAYNEDKQAIIKDASKGSFADLVEAAEACPAACIHPGVPLNQNEPDLAEFLERAKKFN